MDYDRLVALRQKTTSATDGRWKTSFICVVAVGLAYNKIMFYVLYGTLKIKVLRSNRALSLLLHASFVNTPELFGVYTSYDYCDSERETS